MHESDIAFFILVFYLLISFSYFLILFKNPKLYTLRNVGIAILTIGLLAFLLPRILFIAGQKVDTLLLNWGWVFCLSIILLYLGLYSLIKLTEYLLDKPNYFVGSFSIKTIGEIIPKFNASAPFGYLKIRTDGIEAGCKFLFFQKTRFFAWDNLELSRGKFLSIKMTSSDSKDIITFSSISKNEQIYQILKSFLEEQKQKRGS